MPAGLEDVRLVDRAEPFKTVVRRRAHREISSTGVIVAEPPRRSSRCSPNADSTAMTLSS